MNGFKNLCMKIGYVTEVGKAATSNMLKLLTEEFRGAA
jgi:hypothetical protein